MKKGQDLKIREKLSKKLPAGCFYCKYIGNRRNRCAINYDKDV